MKTINIYSSNYSLSLSAEIYEWKLAGKYFDLMRNMQIYDEKC